MSRERFPGRIRLARALRAAGPRGVHSLTVREDLKIGNPSERIADLERRGFDISATVEPRNGRHGSRYVMTKDVGDSAAWLTDAQLDDAEFGDGSPPMQARMAETPAVAELSAEPEPACFLADYTREGFRPQESPDEFFPLVPLRDVWPYNLTPPMTLKRRAA